MGAVWLLLNCVCCGVYSNLCFFSSGCSFVVRGCCCDVLCGVFRRLIFYYCLWLWGEKSRCAREGGRSGWMNSFGKMDDSLSGRMKIFVGDVVTDC